MNMCIHSESMYSKSMCIHSKSMYSETGVSALQANLQMACWMNQLSQSPYFAWPTQKSNPMATIYEKIKIEIFSAEIPASNK